MRNPALRLLLLLCILGLQSPAWAMFQLLTGANHPELHWRTLRTAHFNIHYHQGLEQTARDCADIAEQVYGPITGQLGVEPRKKTEIAITDVDDIVNGFAFRNRIAIWVHQNDYIKHFSQRREWLHQVVAHEFQHTVAFAALRDWRGLLGMGLSETPAWWMEGLAEYYTENWNTLRSDQALRRETLDLRLKASEAHDGGYAKVLYLAWRDGDSTLVKICRWRDPHLRTYSFPKAFKKTTGQSVGQFEAEWSRVVHGLYNAELALCEPLDEIGSRVELPLDRVDWLALLPDSSAWLAVGRDSLNRLDNALYRVGCDSLHKVERLAQGRLLERAALASDGSRVVFARIQQDRHGSLLPDLWSLDLSTGRERRLTRGTRAHDPALAVDGALAWVDTQGDRHRVMLKEGEQERVWWDPGPGWEMVRPDFSPDGLTLALATDDPSSTKRITLLERNAGGVTHLDPRFEDERDPVWSSDSLLVMTAYADYRANLFARNRQGDLWRISDSGEGLRGLGRQGGPGPLRLLALALDSSRTSRPLLVDPQRRAEAAELKLQPRYTAWRRQMPARRVPDWDRSAHAELLSQGRYQAWAVKPLLGVLLPMPDGALGTILLADPLMKNQLNLSGGYQKGERPLVQLGWINCSLDWTLSLSGGWNTDYGLTLVNDELLEVNGSSLSASLGRSWRLFNRPYGRLSASLGSRLEDLRRVGRHELDEDSLFAPGEGRSGQLSLTLRWEEGPLEADGEWWPSWSHGLQVHASLARPWLSGQEQVDYWRADLYRIQSLPHNSLRLVGAARLDILAGRRDTWRSLGFSPDPLLDIAGALGLGSSGLPQGPVSHLRGLQRDVAGDRVFQSSVELRFSPGAPELFKVLEVANARVTLAPFADFGHVADRARLAPGEPNLWLWTSGVELQMGLKIEEMILASLGVGVGSEDLDWLRSGHDRHGYWKLILSRPF